MYEAALGRAEGELGADGQLVVETGQHTGRSPKDKFFVKEPSSESHIDWGETNRPVSEATFDALFDRVADYLRGRETFVLDAYVGAALALDERSDVVAARAWVGVWAEALGDPKLHAKIRRVLDAEVTHVERRSRGTLTTADAAAVVAFVMGALVFGAFAPRKTAGFAAPSLRRMLRGLQKAR